MEGKDDRRLELATLLVGLCLQELISLGRVTREQVNGIWYVEFNDVKLQAKGFGGAATLDRLNRPVIYLSSRLNIEGLMFVIAHETVHLMQICKGDFVPFNGFSIWKGKEYVLLPHDDPDYFEAQPWEQQANELQHILVKHLKSKVNLPKSDVQQSEP